MKLGDFVVYCGHICIAAAQRVDGSVDLEDLRGHTLVTLKEEDIKQLTKADCWYKGK